MPKSATWMRPVPGDFRRGVFAAGVVFAAAYAFARFCAGTPRESWLARLYLQFGDPKEIREQMGLVAVGVILAAVYLLWSYQRVFTGEPEGPNLTLPDIKVREVCAVVPLLALSLFLGLYPNPVLDRLQPSVDALICHVEQSSSYRQPAVATNGPRAAASTRDTCTGVTK